MTAIIPSFAPGCFGSALAFEEAAPVCSVCKFAEACRPLHESNLMILRERVGVKGKGNKNAKNPLVVDKPAAAPAELTLPKKVQALVEKLDNSSLFVTEKLKRGENPFSQPGMSFMKIAAHLLLKMTKPLDRPTLAYAFTAKLGWTDGTADSHARMAIQALTHIGAVENVDGLITLRREF
jgi:hypothetical protein